MAEWGKSNIYLLTGEQTEINVEQLIFPDGAVNVRIPNNTNLFDSNSLSQITAVIKSSNDIMALMLTVDAIVNYSSSIVDMSNTILNIPYFPYSRQDRVCNRGEARSIKVMANIINLLGFKRVYIFDPHSDVTSALIDKVVVVDQSSLINKLKYQYSHDTLSQYNIFVSPDMGAEKKVYAACKDLNKGIIEFRKNRDISTGEIIGMELTSDKFIVPFDSKLLIVDDICDGGRTFIEASKILQNKLHLPKRNIDLFVTHGMFTKGFDVFKGYVNKIYYTNSLKQEPDSSIYKILTKEIGE